MPPRRFPPPWSIEELEACFVVRDHDGQSPAYQSKFPNHSPTVIARTTATAMSANTLSVSDIAFSSMLPSTLTAVAAAPITCPLF